MNHREQVDALTQEMIQSRGELNWEDFAKCLCRQICWARDKLIRGEQLCDDSWDRAHMRTIAQALSSDHPLLQRYSAEMQSTGKKYDQGKPPIDLVPVEPVRQIAQILGHGAEKYGAHNWRGGLAASRLYAALQRHLMAWLEGEDMDPVAQGGSGLPHLAHAACELFFLIQTLKDRPDLDDRYKPRPEDIAREATLVAQMRVMQDEINSKHNSTLGDRTKAHLGDAR